LKKTEKTLSIPKSKKIKIFSIAALSKAHKTMVFMQKNLKTGVDYSAIPWSG
jgi:hypothetical protein